MTSPGEKSAQNRERQAAVKHGRWKLIEYYPPAEPRVQLFDLRDDPWEMRDCSSDPDCASILAGLRAELGDWRARELGAPRDQSG